MDVPLRFTSAIDRPNQAAPHCNSANHNRNKVLPEQNDYQNQSKAFLAVVGMKTIATRGAHYLVKGEDASRVRLRAKKSFISRLQEVWFGSGPRR